jgi:hypothetical protein
MNHASTKKTIQKELDDTLSAAENDDGNHDDERYSPPRQRSCHQLSGKDTRTEPRRRSSRLANRASDVVLKNPPAVKQQILCMKIGRKLLPFHGTLHGTKEEAKKQSIQILGSGECIKMGASAFFAPSARELGWLVEYCEYEHANAKLELRQDEVKNWTSGDKEPKFYADLVQMADIKCGDPIRFCYDCTAGRGDFVHLTTLSPDAPKAEKRKPGRPPKRNDHSKQSRNRKGQFGKHTRSEGAQEGGAGGSPLGGQAVEMISDFVDYTEKTSETKPCFFF